MRESVAASGLRQADTVEQVRRYAPWVGLSQANVSRILRGNAKGHSQSRLIVIIAAFGNDVSIVVEPAKGRGRICIRETRPAAQSGVYSIPSFLMR